MKLLRTVDDVTPEVLALSEDVEQWFADDERIDWEAFIDKLAEYGEQASEPFDIDQLDNPAIRKIKRHIKALRDAG